MNSASHNSATADSHDPLTLQVETVLTTACFGVAGVYGVMHLAAIAFPPPWNQDLLNVTGLLWSVICLALGVFVSRNLLRGEAPHAILALLAIGMISHATLVLHVLDDPVHSLNLVLIVISAGYFFAKRGWFYTCLGLLSAAWASAFVATAQDFGDWRIWGGTLLVGIALAITLFEARRRTTLKIHSLNLQAKESQDQQRKMQRVMEEAQRRESLGILAGGIAHDFNNLLTIIKGNTELAVSHVGGDTKAIALLADVDKAASRAADLTQLMLVYAGRSRPKIAQFDLVACIEGNISLIASSLPRGVTVTAIGAMRELWLEADKTLVDQIVLNLIQNAIDASKDDKSRISVTWGTEELRPGSIDPARFVVIPAAGQFAFVDVQDAGAGMSPEIQSQIFEPFFSTKFDGSGLGLAAVRGIVESHTGGLQVTSQVGSGTTIRVLLPITDQRLAVDSLKTTSAAARATAEVAPSNFSILIIDDEPEVRSVARRMLNSVGFHVQVAESGSQALAKLGKQREADLAIVDLTMPEEDGVQVIGQLLEKRPEMKVVLMSGFDLDEAIPSERRVPSGLPLIEKPFSLAQLVHTAEKALGISTGPN